MALYTKSGYDKKISAVDKAAENISKAIQEEQQVVVKEEKLYEYSLLHPDLLKDGVFYVGKSEYKIHKGIVKTLSEGIKNELIKSGFMFMYKKEV